jgi:hypothetical protein
MMHHPLDYARDECILDEGLLGGVVTLEKSLSRARKKMVPNECVNLGASRELRHSICCADALEELNDPVDRATGHLPRPVE